jgi:hypothetical protein
MDNAANAKKLQHPLGIATLVEEQERSERES